MHSERVEFTGSAGTQLAGRLDQPDGIPRAFALFAHCFTCCTKDVLAASRIAGELTKHGIAVLRFDFTGLGGSGGDFGNTNFSSNMADLVHAATTCATVLAATELIPQTCAVVTIGAPADTEHLAELMGDNLREIEQSGEAEVCLASRPFRIQRQFLDDIRSQPQAQRIAGLGVALLVMHSPQDETVGKAGHRSREGREDRHRCRATVPALCFAPTSGAGSM